MKKVNPRQPAYEPDNAPLTQAELEAIRKAVAHHKFRATKSLL